jgi:hypothetical protein
MGPGEATITMETPQNLPVLVSGGGDLDNLSRQGKSNRDIL